MSFSTKKKKNGALMQNKKKDKKHIEVVASVIFDGRSVYCFKKGQHKHEYLSNKFEFPGGKIKLGENKEDALRREIMEELNVVIKVLEPLLEFDFEYPDFSLTMTCFKCSLQSGTFHLSEHTQVILQPIEELEQLEWLPADIPIVNFIREFCDG